MGKKSIKFSKKFPRTFTPIFWAGMIICLALWPIFIFIYCNLQRIFDLEDWRGGLEGYKIFFEPIFYLTVFLTTVTALIKDLAWKG